MCDTSDISKCRVYAHGFCNGRCEECKPHEVAEVVAMMVEAEPTSALVCLKDLGYEFSLEDFQHEDPGSNFYCSILKTDVSIPCALNCCPYWVDKKQSLNCLLCYYKNREGNEELTTREISEVFGYTISETNTLLESALTSLRHLSIGLPIGNKDLQETFEFLLTKDVCCVCEKPTPEDLTEILEVPELGLAYCSLVCRIRKNPTVISLEHKFHADIADILDWTLANFCKAKAMEQALNMDSYAIQQMIRQFLGKNALDAFPGEKLPEAIQPFDVLFFSTS